MGIDGITNLYFLLKESVGIKSLRSTTINTQQQIDFDEINYKIAKAEMEISKAKKEAKQFALLKNNSELLQQDQEVIVYYIKYYNERLDEIPGKIQQQQEAIKALKAQLRSLGK